MERWAKELLHAANMLYFNIIVRKACKSRTAKKNTVTILSVPVKHQCLKMIVMKRKSSNCQQSACVHLYVGLSTTKLNVYGVWCMQGKNTKHPKSTRGQLHRLNTRSAGRFFRRHTVLIEDKELRSHLSKQVESTTALLDPFAIDIMYHHACWPKWITNTKLQ